ncbi:serum amyloid P-component-like [Hypomesus transpacificus]|uniref:serum amyloid P-component-like n=1 Tax=Hypomesus transpacificus TaxID=137520 RepID=UPI001F07D41D|nr:serum amyloid P-component-like [Hypomesus transpacificus]
MKKLVYLVMLMVCSAQKNTEDLFESAFTFPEESKTTHVRIMPKSTQTVINTVTVCLRFFTHLTRDYSLFSLALPEQANSFLLWREKDGVYSVYVNDQVVFPGLKGVLNQWNSLCATWETTTGLAQVWLNTKSSPRKSVSPGYSIRGIPSIILGQDQDSYGGGFEAAQSFVGSMTDVYMWDSVLSPKEIQYYMTGIIVRPGNVVDWRQMVFTVTGAVVEETSVLGFVYHCN